MSDGRTVGEISIHWRRLDRPGRDAARVGPLPDGWRITGVAHFTDGRQACRLRYRVDCDRRWVTRAVGVDGQLGEQRVALAITADSGRNWRLDGQPQPAVSGCLGVDLAFTPATNLLPIRRLGLSVGGSAAVSAAWLTFPELRLERLEQRYTRTGVSTYDYEVAALSFRTTLTVTPSGFVARYPDLWEVVRG